MADISTTIFEELRHDIISLNIKPGEKIVESDVCERFSVTRPPVRSAFQRLQDVGLLDVIPYRGARATLLDLDAINQIVYNRVIIESRVIIDFINAEPSLLDIEDLEHNLRKQEIHISHRPVDGKVFYGLDSEFHEFWFNDRKCGYIWNQIQSDSEYERFRMLDFVGTEKYTEIVEDHRAIAEVIKDKNLKKVPHIIAKHLNNGIRRMNHMDNPEFERYFKKMTDKDFWKKYYQDNFDL